MANFLMQAFKYAIVGVMNTLVTFIVYYVLTKLSLSHDLSNFISYVAGLINSFIWNRQWTFKQSGAWLGSSLRFLLLFAACYLLQWLLFYFLNQHIEHIYSFVIAMVFYNIIFFLSNKYIVFKENIKDENSDNNNPLL